MCPNWLIVLLLVLLCAYSGKRTIDQAWKRYAKESQQAASATTAYAKVPQEEVEMQSPGAPQAASESTTESQGVPQDEKALAKEVDAESAFPWGSLLKLVRTWLAVMGLSLLKGGHGAPSLLGVSCGTPGYWAVVLLNIPVLGFLT